MKKKKKKVKLTYKGKKTLLISLLVIVFIAGLGIVLYINIHGLDSKLSTKIKGSKNIVIEVGKKYKEKGVITFYDGKKVKNKVTISNKTNNKRIGTYEVTYKVKYKGLTRTLKRKVKVVDKTKPVITLKGNMQDIYVGEEYKEEGYTAKDNYDGDLTKKVKVENNIDNTKAGEYKVLYKVKDSSGNKAEVMRAVNVKEKVISPVNSSRRGGVAVLNYHFFYDSSIGEVCNDGNCEDLKDFKAQLNYLKENNYKTLTMKEFRDYMYGELDIPEKAVLITIDDGALGTGIDNGNKLIPVLEEYKMHATLFLITGWWDINNYRSKYLEIESHTNDMHTERFCDGVTRGAKMLCLSNEEVLNDLKASINITKSNLAFCFPFYAYSDNAINLVKEAGFQLAFIGGGYKANRSMDKYHIPRYQIKQSTSLETFINYVS